MTMKKAELEQPRRVREFARKVALAYVGAFGVVGDEAGSLFERFVDRGEQMEIDARKRLKRNDKQARHLAGELKKEQKASVARANKTVKKAVKQVEQAIA